MRRVLVVSVLAGLLVAPFAAPPAAAAPTGVLSTVAGLGVLDGHPATSAIVDAADTATAPDGTIYVADTGSHRIRRIGTDGVITTIAGSYAGYAGDGGPASAALFRSPGRIALAADGDVLVADAGNRRVRRIDVATGTVKTVAGNGTWGTAVPHADATTQPVTPADVAYDTANDRVLVAEQSTHRVWAVTAAGALEAFAGNGTPAAVNQLPAPATGTSLSLPRALAVAPDGSVYVGGNMDVRRVSGGTVSLVAGGGNEAPEDGVAATAAILGSVMWLTVGGDGSLYFGDPVSTPTATRGRVRTVTAGGALASVAGAPCQDVHETDPSGRLLVGCGGKAWRLADGTWVRVAGQQDLVARVPHGTPVADAGFRPGSAATGATRAGNDLVLAHGVTLYRIAAGQVLVEAGNGVRGTGTPDGTPAQAAAISPCVVTALADGTVAFSEAGRVRGVAGGVLTTIVGGPMASRTFTEGMPAKDYLPGDYCPALAPAPGGDLYVASGPSLFRVDVAAGTLHRVAETFCPTLPGSAIHRLAARGGVVVAGYHRGAPGGTRAVLCASDTPGGEGRQVFAAYAAVDAIDLTPDGRIVVALQLPNLTTAVRLVTLDGGVTTLADGGSNDSPTSSIGDAALEPFAAIIAEEDGALTWFGRSRGWVRRLGPGWSAPPVDGVTGFTATMTYTAPPTASYTLSWTPPATPHDRIRVEVYRADRPYEVGQPEGVWLPAGATTHTFTGLADGLPYVFDVRPTRESDVEWAPRTAATVVPGHTVGPADPAGLYVRSSGAATSLVWSPPAGDGIVETEVRVAPGPTPPATVADGTRLYRGTGTGAVTYDLTQGTTYSATVFGLTAEGVASQAWTRTFEAGHAPRVVLTTAPAYDSWTTRDLTVTWTVGGGASATGCYLDGAERACAGGTWRLTGLTAGSHSVEVQPRSPLVPTGLVGYAGTVFTVDTTLPTVATTALAARWTLTGSTTVRYGGTDTGSGIASYDVRYRRVTYTGKYGAYTSPAGWLGTTATAKTLSGLAPGYTYCFSSRARDVAGNLSAWSAERCTAVPLDDRSLSASSGWKRVTSSAYYAGTYTGTTTTGRTLSRSGTVVGRIALVATTCASCGSVGVYVNGRLYKSVSLRSSTTRRKAVIELPLVSLRTATVTIKVTSSGKLVAIDGLGISRR